ncbi:MAG TPA: multicopper oxidase domain-containing protein, partial [Burkholderiaceae bacterium]|nr:multicopper oxidase domain-containing protein [Burkholderiaceae bacterium]
RRGRRDAVRPAAEPSASYLGPVLDLRRGERVRIHFLNRTGEPSTVHWHGMLVPEHADGHPRFAIASGTEYVYEFEVRNPAGTYLYHPHPHGRTGPQVYAGLAGLLIVREPREAAIGLPAPEHELNLVLQDRRVGSSNQFAFQRMMMDEMTGVLGDRVLVNGTPDAAFKVARRGYRLRIANVSNARIYKLAWSDERPLHVIAADNGFLSHDEGVQVRPYVVLAPFERIELLEDFGARAGGAEVALISRQFEDSMMTGMMNGMMGGRRGGMMGGGGMGGMMGRGGNGMMGGMMSGGQGKELHIARFTVAREPRVSGAAPQLPAPLAPAREGKHELHTELEFRHMRGFLNGRAFDHQDMTAVADDERLPVGEGTVWTFANDDSGMMSMSHPIHIHGVRFRVLERAGTAAPADLREGLIDAGYKDTFLIFPGERVRVLVAPTEPGLFLYHCHNLEHEDGGMMRNCRFA